MKKHKNYDVVMQYVKDIVDGKIAANHYRILACKRFLADLENPE